MPNSSSSGPYILASTEDAFFASEKRLHIRAYHYWERLAADRPYPRLSDLSDEDVADFRLNSALISVAEDQASLVFVGAKLSAASGGDVATASLSSVPADSLLGQVLHHYPAVLADGVPVGLDAHLPLPDGRDLPYRGILLPFSNDGEHVHHIIAVISWKESLLINQQTLVDLPEKQSIAATIGTLMEQTEPGENAACALLEELPVLSREALGRLAGDRRYHLILGRREADGTVSPLLPIDVPCELFEKAITLALEQMKSRT